MCRDESNQSINQSTDLLICSTVRCVRYSLCLFPVISYDTTLLVATDCTVVQYRIDLIFTYFLLTPFPSYILRWYPYTSFSLSLCVFLKWENKQANTVKFNYSTVQYSCCCLRSSTNCFYV